ncbi:MAG: hypothetical protein WC606_04975 [Candidatus Absconditabacterales bacterium]
MESNQVNTSPETSGIPQGIPTGVFVANNQTPATVDKVVPVAPSVTTSEPVLATEGPLDRIFRGLARFFAKVTGQPDPITGASNPASKTLQKGQDIVGKVRGAANQAVAKASDVASKAVDTATNVANQAAQKVQQVIPPPTAPAKSTPVVEQPVQSTSEQTK